MYKHRMTYWARIAAFILNVAMLIAAFILLGTAIWMENKKSFEKELRSVVFSYNDTGDLGYYKYQTRVWVISVYWSIFGIGLGALAVAILGSVGAIHRGISLLWTYIGLMLSLILVEIGSGIAILVQRSTLKTTVENLIYSIFFSENFHDIRIIKQMYNCCQTIPYRVYCISMPQCTTTVWNSVDNTMMISGIILLPILILQILTVILFAPIMIDRRNNAKLDKRFVSKSIERF